MGPRARDDTRTAEQRRADALSELIDRALGGDKGRKKPAQITLIATVDNLLGKDGAMPPKLQGLYPVSRETLERYLCDGVITPLVVDGKGVPLFLGRSVRTFTPGQRKALAATQLHCLWPDCDRPVDWTDGHHKEWWKYGGKTDVDKGMLICGRHHTFVHEGGWNLDVADDGKVTVRPPPQPQLR